ncbi:MAG TPA: HutD family protein [Oleiagrimonas sp.]|nr:HutD family protein [Oleiagrimonas sp.]
MDMLQAVSPSQFREQPWANGSGQTTELAAGPDRDHWQWRISLARIDVDGPFSVLPGVRRQLAPLDGRLELHFDNDEQIHAKRLQVMHFDGGRTLACHSPDGPGCDFNLMLRDNVDGDLVVRPLLGSMVCLPRADTRWFAYMLGGQAEVSAGNEQLLLEAGHAAWIQPQSGARALIDGGGEIALVRLTLPKAC